MQLWRVCINNKLQLQIMLQHGMHITEASRHLRSSGAITCVIPWSRSRLGDRSFDVAGPRLWNKLPASLQSSDSLCRFRRQLKTFCLSSTRLRHLVTLAFRRRIQILLLNYLLTLLTEDSSFTDLADTFSIASNVFARHKYGTLSTNKQFD